MTPVDGSTLEAFLAHLERGDRSAALTTANQLVGSEAAPVGLLDGLIPSAMREVGLRWERGSWTVAREHVATHICDSIFSELTPQSARPQEEAAGKALVACAEGEWHALPARAAAIGLEQAGWDVTTLGPSVPASQLGTMIHDMGPDIVAVSCSMAANLPGARRMIVTSRETGTPVIVGGRGFGPHSTRADLLGASGWAGTVHDLIRIAADSERFCSPAGPIEHPRHAVYEAVVRHQAAITSSIDERMIGAGEDPSDVAQTAVWILRSLKASLLCDDLSILTDDLTWHQGRADIGLGLDPQPFTEAMRDAMTSGSPEAADWLRQAERLAWK